MPGRFLILLVEDNAADVFLLQEVFKELPGCAKLHVVRDGQEALAFLHGVEAMSPPDLVLLDLNLPLLNGHQVLQAIKTDPRTRTLPVIIFSSSAAEGDVRRAYDLQANSYIQKPMDWDGLFQVVSAIHSFWLRAVWLPPRETVPGTDVAVS